MGGNKQEEINHFGSTLKLTKMTANLSTRERSTSTSSSNNINNNNNHMNEVSNHVSSPGNGGIRVHNNIMDTPGNTPGNNIGGSGDGGSPNSSGSPSSSPRQSGSPRLNNKDSPNSISNGSSGTGDLLDTIANQPPVPKDNIEEGRDNHSPSPAYSTQKVGDLPYKATVSKGRNPRYMGMDTYPVTATPPRMPMNTPPPPPPPPANISQFNLNNYRQLSKEERRRLLKEVKMVLGEESLLSGMNNRHGGSADDDDDAEEESLLASSEEQSQANTFFSEDRTMYTEDRTAYTEDRTMYTADTSAFYTEGDTSTFMSGYDSRRWSNRRSGSRNNSLLSDNEDEFSDEDEHFFSLTDACLSFLCDGNRQEAEEMAKAKRDRREQRQRRRREEDNWNKAGRRYERQRRREEAEDEGDDETVGTNDHDNAWKRNSTTNSGLTVKHRLQSRLQEAKKFERIPEQEEQAKNNAVTPPEYTADEEVQDAANETSMWKDDRNTEDDDSSSDDAVIPGGASRGNDNTNNIAEVVTEMEPEPSTLVTKSPSLKITLYHGDEPVDEPVDCNEGGKFSKGRSLTMKERSSSPFVRAMSSLSKQKSRLDKAAPAVTVKQDPSVCSTKTSSDESTARSAKTTKSAKSGSGSVKSVKSTKSIIPRNQKVWKEYVDSNTGNKYYSDGTTTTWERPANARIISGSRSGTPTTPIAGSANKPSYSVASTPVVSNKSLLSKKATASPSSSVEKEQAVDMPPRVVNNSRRKKLKLFSKYKKNNTTKKTTQQQSNKNTTIATTTSKDPDGPLGAVTRWSRSMSRAKKRNDDDDPVAAADPASPDRTEASFGSINSAEGGNSPVSLASHVVPMNSPLANIITNNDYNNHAMANDSSYDDIVTHTVTSSVTSRPRNGSSNDSKNNKTKTTTTPSANNTPKRKKKKGWKEFTDPTSGKKYYSDGVTTTWNRPANFNGNSSPVTSHVTATSATSFDPAATSKSPLPKISSNSSDHTSQKTDKAKTKRKKKGWREFTDTNTGTKYYSDGVTTTWDRPANF